MRKNDVDEFFAASSRTLPARPEWRQVNRPGERRSRIGVVVDGRSSGFDIELTVLLADASYLVAVLVGGNACLARLCMGPGHRDVLTRQVITDPHFHGWTANRPASQTLPKRLRHYVILPASAKGRSAGLAWFLGEIGVDSPSWFPPEWPENVGFI